MTYDRSYVLLVFPVVCIIYDHSYVFMIIAKCAANARRLQHGSEVRVCARVGVPN